MVRQNRVISNEEAHRKEVAEQFEYWVSLTQKAYIKVLEWQLATIEEENKLLKFSAQALKRPSKLRKSNSKLLSYRCVN